MNLFYDFVINTLEVVDGVKIFIVFFHPFPHLGNVIAFRITMFSLFLFFLDLFFPIVYVFLGETLSFTIPVTCISEPTNSLLKPLILPEASTRRVVSPLGSVMKQRRPELLQVCFTFPCKTNRVVYFLFCQLVVNYLHSSSFGFVRLLLLVWSFDFLCRRLENKKEFLPKLK